MKNKNLPLSKERWYKKLLVCLIIIVTLFVSIGIFIFKDFGLGYKYYERIENQQMFVGATLQENLLEKTINEYLKQLTNNGYYIVSIKPDATFIDKKTIIPKSITNDDELKEKVVNNLTVSVLCTKLEIKNDETIYYFKTEQECNDFINELNKYIPQEYVVEGYVENYKFITSQEVLDNKLNNVIKEKERIEAEKRAEEARKAEEARRTEAARKAAEAKKKEQAVSSRSSVARTTINNKYSGGAPMASYTYISCYYGNGHTGVDFAAPAGTHIYAWKDGKITTASWCGSYGNFVIVQHNDGTTSRYAHLSGYACSVGQTVSKGQIIGYVGTTGNSTGNHLHFEIQVNGRFVNPLNYL